MQLLLESLCKVDIMVYWVEGLGQIYESSYADLFIVHGGDDAIKDLQVSNDAAVASSEPRRHIWYDIVGVNEVG